jgi:hypothetical protein
MTSLASQAVICESSSLGAALWLNKHGQIDLNDVPFNFSNPRKFDMDELNRRLKERAHVWVPMLFTNGIEDKAAGVIRCANPYGDPPRKQGSCHINMTGEYAGGFYDHATGEKGGPLKTIMCITGLDSGQAREFAADLVQLEPIGGGTAPPNPPRVKAPKLPDVIPPQPTAPARDPDRYKGDIALIRQGCVGLAGTPAADYLTSRKLPIPDCPDLLFNPDVADHREKRGYAAMIAIIRRPDGSETGGLHRTFLHDETAPDGTVGKHKKMLGSADYGCIHLAPVDAAERVLGIAEGIESAIAVNAMFNVPCWPCLSAGGMGKFEPPPGVDTLYIFADTGDAGMKGARKAKSNAEMLGVSAVIIEPEGGDDFAADWAANQCQRALPAVAEILPPVDGYDDLAEAVKQVEAHNPDQQQAIVERIAKAGLNELQINSLRGMLKTHAKIPAATFDKMLGRILPERTSVAVAETDAVRRIKDRYVWVADQDGFFDRTRRKRQLISINGVRGRHLAEMPLEDDGRPICPTKFLTSDADRKAVDFIDFRPGEPEFAQDERGVLTVNLWRPTPLEPVDGDPSPFVDHVRYVFDGDDQHAGYLLDYCAYMVQHPGRKMKVCPLIIGGQGIGKDLIADSIVPALGKDYCDRVDATVFGEDYNGYLVDRVFVTVGETNIGSPVLMNKLKQQVTNETAYINQKYIQQYQQEVTVNFMLFSNHDDALRLEPDDRRFFVWRSRAVRREPPHYQEYVKWLRGGGHGIIYNHLLNRDLSGFNAHGPAPMTEAKSNLQQSGGKEDDASLMEMFDAGEAPFNCDLIVVSDVLKYLHKEVGMRVKENQLTAFLRSVGAEALGRQRLGWKFDGTGKVQVRVWAIRNVDHWKAADPDQIAKTYNFAGKMHGYPASQPIV